MGANYVNPLGGVCGTGTDHRTLPEAELWTQVILQAITDLDGRTSLTPHWAKNSAREWFASESDAVGSFIWACQIINVDPNFVRSRIAKKQRMTKSDEIVKIPMGQAVKFVEEKWSVSSQSKPTCCRIPIAPKPLVRHCSYKGLVNRYCRLR